MLEVGGGVSGLQLVKLQAELHQTLSVNLAPLGGGVGPRDMCGG